MTKDRQDKDEEKDPTEDAAEEPEPRDDEDEEPEDDDEDEESDDKADEDDESDAKKAEEADEDDEDDEEEAPKPAAKPAAAAATTKQPSGGASKTTAKKKGAATKGSRPGAGKAPPKKSGGMRSILIYALIIGGIALAFAYLGQQGGGGDAEVPQPTWKEGDVADVAITLVTTDVKDLGCAAEEEVKGLHCAFADKRKPHPKGADPRTDDKILQPYTTVDRLQFLAAGMWQSPEMKAKLDAENWSNPSPRFTVDCKFKVEGKMKEALIRWKPENDWLPAPGRDWYTGSLSDCKVRQAGRKAPAASAKPKAE